MKLYQKIFFSVLFVAVVAACRGDQQSKLIGTWEQISFYDPEVNTTKTMWEFYAGDAVHIYKVNDDATVDSLKYTYNISGSTFEVFSGADDPEYLHAARDPRGSYWVDELKKSTFKITKRKHADGTTDAVYMRLEFVKR